jgi:hypothetical protein
MERLQRKALNLQSYSDSDGFSFNTRGLIADTAALATEVGTHRPAEERVHQTLEAVVNGIVVNFTVNKEKDVLEMFEKNSPESVGGGKIVKTLLEEEEGTLFAWLSPPGQLRNYDGKTCEYEEGRIRIGIVREKMGFKILESYGIPTDFEPEVYLNMFYKLQEFSDKEGQTPKNPNDLRDKIVVFKSPTGNKNRTDWLDFLSSNDALPELDSVFESIKSGKVGELNRKAKREAREEIQKVLPELKKVEIHINEIDAIRIGALIERGMINRGWDMISKICGMLNSNLLNQQGLFLQVGMVDGRISVGLSDQFGPLEFTCPECNYPNKREPGKFVETCQNTKCTKPEAVRC